MFFVKYVLLVIGIGMLVTAATAIANDLWLLRQYHRRLASGAVAIEPPHARWCASFALTCLAWAPILIALSIAIGTN